MATENTKNICVGWCVTKVKALETKYQWTIQDFNIDMLKIPLDCLKSGIFVSTLDDKTIEWQLKLHLKANKDYLSMSLCRLDNVKDIKPIVKVKFMIINCNQQIEHTVDTVIDEILYGRELEIPHFIKINSPILKQNENLSIICCLKIGLNTVKVFSSGENSIEPNTNNHCSTSQVIIDLQKLNGNNSLCDCILTCQGKKFYVQKAILAARSSTFFNMFKTNQNITQEIEIYDIPLSTDILSEVLNFIYTGKLQNVEKSTDYLLRAANKYGLPSMTKLCAIYLGKKLCIDNVIETLVLSQDCNSIDLKQQAIDFMTAHARDIVTSPKFKTIGSLPDDIRENIMRILLQKVDC